MQLKKKVNRFLKLWGLFNIVSFFIVLCVCSYFALSNVDAWCFEVMPESAENQFFYFDNQSVSLYVPETNCSVISFDEYKIIENKASRFFWLSFGCIIAFVLFSPEFYSNLRAVFEKFK